jgi:hypothetical protein
MVTLALVDEIEESDFVDAIASLAMVMDFNIIDPTTKHLQNRGCDAETVLYSEIVGLVTMLDESPATYFPDLATADVD